MQALDCYQSALRDDRRHVTSDRWNRCRIHNFIGTGDRRHQLASGPFW